MSSVQRHPLRASGSSTFEKARLAVANPVFSTSDSILFFKDVVWYRPVLRLFEPACRKLASIPDIQQAFR